jgi:hypothetical protein
MASMPTLQLSGDQQIATQAFVADLRRIFGARLRSVVAYGLRDVAAWDGLLHTLVLVERITFEDLAACLPSAERWRRTGLEVPLLLGIEEFVRTLDVFPAEYGDIIAEHILIEGEPPFSATSVLEGDLRRACELQAKSHLIHLREGFLESGGDARRIAGLIAASAGAFRSLLTRIARLDAQERPRSDEALARAAERTIGIPATLVLEVLASPAAGTIIAEPTALLSRYITASEQVWTYVDGWRGR